MLAAGIYCLRVICMERRQIIFRDTENDDFAASCGKIAAESVDKEYTYISRNPFLRLLSAVIYHVICPPILFLYSKIKCGYKIIGKEKLKKVSGGYFVYSNHTQGELDAFLPNLLSFPRRTCIITGREAVSIKGLRELVKMLGAIPIASTVSGMKNMFSAVKARVDSGCAVAIFPEAHIWPYYTRIRPFPSGSFKFPCKTDKPCFSFTVTYRDRYILFYKCKRPGITAYVDGPFYPDQTLPLIRAQEKLCRRVYESMVYHSLLCEQPEYIEYVQEDPVQ